MGKIQEFVEESFDRHRDGAITLKELVLTLCGYADTHIASRQNMGIFEEAVEKEFNEEGDIAQ